MRITIQVLIKHMIIFHPEQTKHLTTETQIINWCNQAENGDLKNLERYTALNMQCTNGTSALIIATKFGEVQSAKYLSQFELRK